MSIITRFLGIQEPSAPEEQPQKKLVANPAIDGSVGISVVLAGLLPVQADAVARCLQKIHPSMSDASCEFDASGGIAGLAGWGKHVVRLFGLDAPFPRAQLEVCVQTAHYGQDIKAKIRQNKSHVLLNYVGYDTEVHEQYVALTCVAEAFVDFGAVAILNETGRTSFPSGFLKSVSAEEGLDALRSLPLTMLFCGFAKYGVEGTKGIWMRTYGAGKFGLPDFAVLAEGHDEASKYSELFDDIWSYMLDTGAEMDSGHTMQIGTDNYLKLRDPAPSEYFLHGPGKVLVASVISANEVNKPDTMD